MTMIERRHQEAMRKLGMSEADYNKQMMFLDAIAPLSKCSECDELFESFRLNEKEICGACENTIVAQMLSEACERLEDEV